VASEETITDQIDHLLEEVLHEQDPPPVAAPQPERLEPSDEDRRVVITGLGLITPFGIGSEPFWAGLEAGHSAIGRITLCDAAPFDCQIAGEVPGFEAGAFLANREARRMSRSSQFAVAAAQLALDDARLIINEDNTNEAGVIIGCGTTSLSETEQAMQSLLQGPHKVRPLYLPSALPHMPACQVAVHMGMQGHISATCTASAAGAQAIGEAAAIIQRGDASIMLAGGTDATITQLGLASFCALHALSTRNEDPARASRPFDAERDGFVPGEGAAVLVLERLSYARQRGAPIYAEVAGHATTSNAYNVLAPDLHGDGAARAMRRALLNARIDPQQVDYISAHAVGSVSGDIAETRAIKQVFGEYASCVPVSAIKSMIGHLNGAAGAVEAAAALLALKHSTLPPTINQEFPDPECDLDYVPNSARQAILQTVISNSFGFGGINTVLVFRRLERNEQLEDNRP
jgi:3-oxoacyl-[acyl-carrier-protein] synthase II